MVCHEADSESSVAHDPERKTGLKGRRHGHLLAGSDGPEQNARYVRFAQVVLRGRYVRGSCQRAAPAMKVKTM